MRQPPIPDSFNVEVHNICCDEIAQMLRHCRSLCLDIPIPGRQLMGHLLFAAFRYYELTGPVQVVDLLERAALYALFERFEPEQIDEALGPAIQAAHDIVKPPKRTGPLRRTRWPGNVVAFDKDKNKTRKNRR